MAAYSGRSGSSSGSARPCLIPHAAVRFAFSQSSTDAGNAATSKFNRLLLTDARPVDDPTQRARVVAQRVVLSPSQPTYARWSGTSDQPIQPRTADRNHRRHGRPSTDATLSARMSANSQSGQSAISASLSTEYPPDGG